MSKSLVMDKSKSFALRIIKLYVFLKDEKKEYVLSKQLLRSGTSVGANIKEALRGQSKKDFHMKMCIALKEIAETEYWLELLHESDFLTKQQFDNIYYDCHEIIKMLASITKTVKNELENR